MKQDWLNRPTCQPSTPCSSPTVTSENPPAPRSNAKAQTDRLVDDIAWTYVLPRPESTPIAGLVSFYNEVVDIDIDGERSPRPISHFA